MPFVFVKTPLIEESSWSVMEKDDFYPTINLIMAAHDTSAEELSTKGLEVSADFDTGSPSLFINYDQMSAHQVVEAGPINQAHYSSHLGRAYKFHFRPLLIGIRSEEGQIAVRKITALCIRNWRASSLCLVNPNREALAGRNLLLDFPLQVVLDGEQKATRIALP